MSDLHELYCFRAAKGSIVTFDGSLLLFRTHALAAQWRRRKMKDWLRRKVEITTFDAAMLEGPRNAIIIMGIDGDEMTYLTAVINPT